MQSSPLLDSVGGSPRRGRQRGPSSPSQSVLQVTIDAEGDALFEEVEQLEDEEAGGIKGCLKCDCDTNDLHYKITLWILILLTLAAFVHAFIMEIGDLTREAHGD